MKRIVMLLFLLFIGNIVKADSVFRCQPNYFDLRWSPYAHNLVRGDLRWSPYAFGLIPKHGSNPVSDGTINILSDSTRVCFVLDSGPNLVYQSRRQTVEQKKEHLEEIKSLKQNDGKEVILKYLEAKGLAGKFKTDHLFSVENRTLSVNFFSNDKNIVVKYWNPEVIASLTRLRKVSYQKYADQWENFSQSFTSAGGKVYYIVSSEKQKIEKELEQIIAVCY